MNARTKRHYNLEAYKEVCKEELAFKESRKIGKTRRGRKKHKVISFPYPKKGKHRTGPDGKTIRWDA